MHDSTNPTRLTRSPRARLLAAAALVSGVLVAGCGGGSPSPSIASVSSTSTSTSSAASTGAATTSPSNAASAPTSQASLDSGALAYSKCMRASGVPSFPDPKAGGGFLFQKGGGIDPSSPVFRAADAKCRKLMPGGGPPGPGTQTHPSSQALAQMLKIAACMRRHGVYDFPEPRTSVPSNLQGALDGAGVISDIDGVILLFPGSIDQQSPIFTRAAATCNFPLHNH